MNRSQCGAPSVSPSPCFSSSAAWFKKTMKREHSVICSENTEGKSITGEMIKTQIRNRFETGGGRKAE